MPELHIERIFKLRNYPSLDIRVVVSSTEGAIIGTSQTGGRMQVVMSSPKAVRIDAGMLHPITRPELPLYVTEIIRETGRSLGPAACFPSRFSISCTVENRSITQDEALRILEDIGRRFEQHVERVEYADRVPSVQVPLSFKPLSLRKEGVVSESYISPIYRRR